MKYEIDLRPHTGIKVVNGKHIQLTHNQWLVFVITPAMPSGMHIGYLGTHEGAPFNALPGFADQSPQCQAEIIAAIENRVGRTLKSFIPPTDPWPDQNPTEGEDGVEESDQE